MLYRIFDYKLNKVISKKLFFFKNFFYLVRIVDDVLYNFTLKKEEIISRGWSGTILQPD
jgi:hypothetical protein